MDCFTLLSARLSSSLTIGSSSDVETLSVSQNFFRFSLSISISDTSLTKKVHAKFVWRTGRSEGQGLPIQVYPRGVSLAAGSTGLPLTSSSA